MIKCCLYNFKVEKIGVSHIIDSSLLILGIIGVIFLAVFSIGVIYCIVKCHAKYDAEKLDNEQLQYIGEHNKRNMSRKR